MNETIGRTYTPAESHEVEEQQPVMLTETYCNKVNIQMTQRDDFIQITCGINKHLFLLQTCFDIFKAIFMDTSLENTDITWQILCQLI